MGLDDLKPFDPKEKVIEYLLEAEDQKKRLIDMTCKGFAEETASESPAPGGGSIAAYMGALGAALGTMVANLSSHKAGWDDRWEEFSGWAEKGQALLRELLELREQRRDLTFESAAVIDRESTNWTSALTLNRGTAHGVEKNDCVVSAEGDLVGVVSAVGYNWCTVLTVIDTDTELGARVFRTQEVAVAEGDLALMGEGKLKLSYLSADAQLLSGDVVTTSGLGGFYPGGLVIGTVESVRTGDDGLAQYAVLALAARLGELSEVFIIKDFDIVD